MNDRQTRLLRSYRRILVYLRDQRTSIAREAPVILHRLERTVADINTYYVKQSIARQDRHVMSARSQLEKMRIEQMLPLARLARRAFAGEPGIQAALRVPHKRAPMEAVLAGAALMVSTLRPHRALLGDSGIDFKRIGELEREARRLKKVFAVAYAASADRAMPTRRLPGLFASAHLDVLAVDALVAACGDKLALLNWKDARRVGKRIGRPPARRKRAP